MNTMLKHLPFRLAWLGMTAACCILFYTTALYFSFCTACNFLLAKQELIDNGFWMSAFYVHITGGMLALVTGPLQFIPSFRNRFLRVHRSLGKVYLAAILFIGAPSGLFMAFYAEGGIWGSIGFTLMALLWLGTTWMAYETIRKRDIAGHRAWMTRSFALTFAAITLRVWVPVASDYLHLDPGFIETSSAWISWIPNLIVAEILLRFTPKIL
jgi:uncharacterized membrane protein